MGIFYDARTVSDEAVLMPAFETALNTQKIDDPDQRRSYAAQLLRNAGVDKKTGKLPDPKWGRVFGALLIAALLFGLALGLENSGQHEESSKTLLRVFEVTFTAILALLGIETAKAKS